MQYRALKRRIDALNRAISDAMEGAMVTGVSYKEKVRSSPKEHDPMAANVCRAVDDSELLSEYRARASTVLRDILESIESLPDERQKEILTRHYINGESFPDIAYSMSYSESMIYIHHGRALLGINKWLQRRAADETDSIGNKESIPLLQAGNHDPGAQDYGSHSCD